MKLIITSLLLIGTAISLIAQEKVAEADPTKRPKVLIIGDSISIGYTPFVIKELAKKAFVSRHKGNAGPTIRAIKNIDAWLGDTKWDIIHFNWGLWDMYGWPYHKEDRSPAMYKKRLEQLVQRLKKTGAKLIWATTTPACPEPEKAMLKRFGNQKIIIKPELEKQYLNAALEVMKKHNIQVNDLHASMAPQREKYAIANNDVHYTKEGKELLGKQVVKAIEKAMDQK